MNEVLLLAFLLVAIACVTDWRWGLLLLPLVGFAQDPIRKLLPTKPVVLVVVVAGVLGLCLASALLRGNLRRIQTAFAVYPELRLPILSFSILVLIQAMRTFLLHGNKTLAGIGLLAYLAPLGAVAAFYLLARDWRMARRWMTVYVFGAAVAAATVALHFLGFSSRLFESIALDTVYGVGGRVQMYCGILRGSEFAAFHAATAACLALAWASGTRERRFLVPVGLMTGVLLLAVILSGRRKMLAQLALFLVVFLFLEARAHGRRGRLLTALTTLGVAGGILWMVSAGEVMGGGLRPYLSRGGSVFGDSVERLRSMTVGSFSGVVNDVGFFGGGAGIASQGAQYYSQPGSSVSSNSEGGLGRVLAELGVPGFLLLALLAWASARALRRVARFAARLDAPDSHLVLGLAAVLPSNATVFITAQQLYGDPFVLIVLGAFFGLALGFPPAVAVALRGKPRLPGTTSLPAEGLPSLGLSKRVGP